MNKETSIQNSILMALSAHGCLAHRQMVGSFRYLHNDGVAKIGTPGMPDIYAIVPYVIKPEDAGRTIGIYAGVEVKTLKGQQRQNQKLYQHAVEKRGGIYIVARSPEEAMRVICL